MVLYLNIYFNNKNGIGINLNMRQIIRNLLSVSNYSPAISIVLLLIRLVVGIAFILHGSQKIQNPTGWMGPDSAFAGFFQFLAAISEFGGGILLVLGLLTPLASFGIACTMTVAVYMHLIVRNDPFVNLTGGSSFELPLTFLCINILFLVMGPGKFSIDKKIFGEQLKKNHKIESR